MTMFPRHRLLVLCTALALSACASAPQAWSPTPQQIPFIDNEGFERQVQGAVGARAETVEIAMLAPASVNSLPPRLSKVLSRVQEAGGKVTVQSGSRGVGGGSERSLLNLLAMIPALMDAVQDARDRQAFRDYDASVTLVEGQVTRVQLNKVR